MPLYEIATFAKRTPTGLIQVNATAKYGVLQAGWRLYLIDARSARHAKDKAKSKRFEEEKRKRV